MSEKDEKTCGTCEWNDNCLCDKFGYIVADDDSACFDYKISSSS